MPKRTVTEKTQSFPPALDRAIKLLDFLASSSESSFSVKELSEYLHIPYASTYRIVKCLEYNEFLTSSIFNKDRYKLGYKLLSMGKMALGQADFVAVSDPYLTDLSASFNQSCKLSTLTQTAVITLDQTLPQEGIILISKLGEERPVNASASGKILTSLQPRPKRMPYLNRALSMNREVIMERYGGLDQLNDYLDQVQVDGFGLDVGEYKPDIGCVAVPLFDNAGRSVAAIGFSGVISHYKDPVELGKMIDALKNASIEISRKLGYTEV